LFEIVKMTRRLADKPYGIVAAVRFSGFLSGYWKREPRQVPQEFMNYLRKEQMVRLRSYFLGT
jgi:hypothetical protein